MYVLAYDISHPKRLKKVSELCKDYGFHRIQKSVFAGSSTDRIFEEFCIHLKRIIDVESDSVIILKLCKRCTDTQISMGIRRVLTEYLDESYILIQ